MPRLTPRLAWLGLVIAVLIALGPDRWPGVGDRVTVGPWELPGPPTVAVAMLLALALIDAALAGDPASIRVERELPSSLALDVQGLIAWTVTNSGRVRRTVSFADELAPSLRAGTRRAVTTLGARGQAVVTSQLWPSRRGRFEIATITVRVEGPLRLGARQSDRQSPSVLRVVPPFRSRDEAELRIANRRVLEVGLRAAKARGAGTEFDQLRDYEPDDDYRTIDWAATARSGRPIVRTYRTERNQRVVCLLDNGRVMAGRVGEIPRVEYAMDAVLTLTAVAIGMGDKCGLVTFDRRVHTMLAPSSAPRQLNRVTRALYELAPVLAESDYRGAFAATVARFRRRAALVILTELVPQVVDESLLAALPLITRTHGVIVAAVRDPEIEQWATDPADDIDGAYRKAAALESLAGRKAAIARLTAMGITVVDAVPERVGAELADAYLGLKRRAEL